MNIYSTDNYRKAIKILIENSKLKGIEITSSLLADQIRVQRPYFSKVMNNQSDLNSDQMFLLCNFFNLNEEEENYMQLLLDYARTGISLKKEKLKSKIKAIQNLNLDIKKHLKHEVITENSPLFNEYYLNPYMQIIHMALLIKRFQNINELVKVLNVNKEMIESVLVKLEQLKLIKKEKNKISVTKNKIHLPKNSFLFHPHQNMVRIQSIQKIQQKINDPNQYCFSATFTADDKIQKEIQLEFLKFLDKVKNHLSEGETKEVFQLNFDLFSWTK